MRQHRSWVVIVSAVLLTACGPRAGGNVTRTDDSCLQCVRPDQEFELGFGSERQIAESPVKIKFVQVLEDSRCPTDVQCVWQGNAKVRVAVDSAGATTVADLNTSLESRSLSAFGYIIELRDVKPAKNSKVAISASEYVAVLGLTRRPS